MVSKSLGLLRFHNIDISSLGVSSHRIYVLIRFQDYTFVSNNYWRNDRMEILRVMVLLNSTMDGIHALLPNNHWNYHCYYQCYYQCYYSFSHVSICWLLLGSNTTLFVIKPNQISFLSHNIPPEWPPCTPQDDYTIRQLYKKKRKICHIKYSML